jgi:hypothetical protein
MAKCARGLERASPRSPGETGGASGASGKAAGRMRSATASHGYARPPWRARELKAETTASSDSDRCVSALTSRGHGLGRTQPANTLYCR